MRIEAYTQIQKVYDTKKTAKTQPKSSSGVSDKLQISSIGKDIQTAKQALAAGGDIREDVTAPIKERMKDGTYAVSADSFADKLLKQYEEMR